MTNVNTPVKFVGSADGPEIDVPFIGLRLPTFTVSSTKKCLKYHVPLEFRGDFKPKDLANFDPEKKYRVDSIGRLLCYGDTKAGEKCQKRAVNRFPRCDIHGGSVHPLDKVIKDAETAENSSQADSLSRYRQFVAGHITVDDLDDEELATCGFRAKDGRIYKPRNVPRELVQSFQRTIFERAKEELLSLTVDAARTIGIIMRDKRVEPDIRLKSALSVIERNLGKTPQVIALTADRPFEEVFDDITTGSRSEYRKSLPSNIIDAEVVGDDSTGTDSESSSDAALIEGVDVDGAKLESADVASGIDHGAEATESFVNARAFERNPAILAQSVERKPFEYDLSVDPEGITKDRKKRYASKALGVDLFAPAIPYIREETPNPDGTVHIRHVDPNSLKVAVPQSNSADRKRKTYTLNDF